MLLVAGGVAVLCVGGAVLVRYIYNKWKDVDPGDIGPYTLMITLEKWSPPPPPPSGESTSRANGLQVYARSKSFDDQFGKNKLIIEQIQRNVILKNLKTLSNWRVELKVVDLTFSARTEADSTTPPVYNKPTVMVTLQSISKSGVDFPSEYRNDILTTIQNVLGEGKIYVLVEPIMKCTTILWPWNNTPCTRMRLWEKKNL